MPNCADREEVVRQLLARGNWSPNQARAAARSCFHCEYCGLDLIESVAHYKLWQLDHIIPKHVKEERGEDPDHMDNLAISCKACNSDFKRRFDPSREAGPDPKREDLLEIVRKHIAPRRRRSEEEVAASAEDSWQDRQSKPIT